MDKRRISGNEEWRCCAPGSRHISDMDHGAPVWYRAPCSGLNGAVNYSRWAGKVPIFDMCHVIARNFLLFNVHVALVAHISDQDIRDDHAEPTAAVSGRPDDPGRPQAAQRAMRRKVAAARQSSTEVGRTKLIRGRRVASAAMRGTNASSAIMSSISLRLAVRTRRQKVCSSILSA